MAVTPKQRRDTKDARLRDIVSRARDGMYGEGDNAMFYALCNAWHDGWGIGFEEREEIQNKYGPNYDRLMALWLAAGASIGAAIVAMLWVAFH